MKKSSVLLEKVEGEQTSLLVSKRLFQVRSWFMCDAAVLLKYTEISPLKILCITININISSLENKARQKLQVGYFDSPPHLWYAGG